MRVNIWVGNHDFRQKWVDFEIEILWVGTGWWGAARFLGGGGPHQQYAPVGQGRLWVHR